MEPISLAQMQKALNQADLSSLPLLNLAVLRNITVEPMEPYLRYLGLDMGFNCSVKFGGFDMVYQEAVGGAGGLLSPDLDCVLLFARLEGLAWDLARNFASLGEEQINSEVHRIEDFCGQVCRGIRSQTGAMILWHGFEPPVHPALGVWDAQGEEGQGATVARLNQALRRGLAETPSAYLVDLGPILMSLGAEGFYDQRLWHMGRAPYSRAALAAIAEQDFRFLRPLKGKSRKCLVLDCDNTLWGGIIGEDGMAGIALGHGHPGSAYVEFQQEVVNLFHRGVIVALCSKNNEADVWEVFNDHPAMVLKPEHIATHRINWQDKVSNLQELAEDLNIGLEAMVFMDDSEFEINAVRQMLPQVTTVHLDPARAVHFRDMLAGGGWFDTLTLSAEDRQRGRMYKAEAERKDLQRQAPDLGAYLDSLEMVVDVRPADELAIPRLAQQTQKTNQFNLTTRRYSEAEITALAAGPDSEVIYLRLRDRFGDSGIVGTCVLRYAGDEAVIDTLLMSCRALGRGVEQVLLHSALKRARARGCRRAIGEYLTTAKNAQVADFYAREGFSEQEAGGVNGRRLFSLDLTAEPAAPHGHFKEIRSELD